MIRWDTKMKEDLHSKEIHSEKQSLVYGECTQKIQNFIEVQHIMRFFPTETLQSAGSHVAIRFTT